MPKNYYVILGIPTNSSLQEIKTAYRRLAKEYHPDYYGHAGSPFPAIQEAYAVLSNPKQRLEYDNTLKRVRSNPPRGETVQRSTVVHEEEVEPLVPEHSDRLHHAHHAQYVQAESRLRAPRPMPGSIFDRFFNTASEQWDYSRQFRENLDIAVILTPEQAYRGGHVRLRLPAGMQCPECLGRGGWGIYECRQCFGTGSLRGEVPLLLNYPAGITTNHRVQFPLHRYGIPGYTLNVRFLIDEDRF